MAEKKGFFQRLKEGLTKTRNSIASGLDRIFSGFSEIDEDFYEELEELLIMADLGFETTEDILEKLRVKVREERVREPEACRELLIQIIQNEMTVDENAYDFTKQLSVVLVIGVNGVGKTTSIGKLAGRMKEGGRNIVLAAADTFRAGAIEQLKEWGKRADVPVISHQEGSDPAAVVYDAVQAAKAKKADCLIVDTAGRLHNKKNLMEELRKIHRILEREFPNAVRESLLVLDGTTGQNALMQARAFAEVTEVTGLILTKLDGTAKGGIAVAVSSELKIPVKYIGVGEKMEDLQEFDPKLFVEALFQKDGQDKEQEETC